MRRLALLCALLFAAAPAWAHPVPFSYLDLRLDAKAGRPSIEGSLTVHVFDAAHELSIDPVERLLDADLAATQGLSLQALMTRRLTIAGDGVPLAIQWGPLEVLRDKQSLRLPFTAGGGRPPAAPARSPATFPPAPRHTNF